MADAKYKVGDWLRWWSHGSKTFIVGEVRYVGEDRWPCEPYREYLTDAGVVAEASVLESRSRSTGESNG